MGKCHNSSKLLYYLVICIWSDVWYGYIVAVSVWCMIWLYSCCWYIIWLSFKKNIYIWESLPTFSIAGLHIDCGPAVQPASSHQDLPCGIDLELWCWSLEGLVQDFSHGADWSIFFEKPQSQIWCFLGVFRKVFFFGKTLHLGEFPFIRMLDELQSQIYYIINASFGRFLLLGCWTNYTHTSFFSKALVPT